MLSYGIEFLFPGLFSLFPADSDGGFPAPLSENLYPANDVPQWADLLLGIVLPRVLILIYIYENMGYNNIWFAVHLVVMVLAYFGGGRETVRRRRVRYVEE